MVTEGHTHPRAIRLIDSSRMDYHAIYREQTAGWHR